MSRKPALQLVRPGRPSPFSRPMPPAGLGEVRTDGTAQRFQPAPDVGLWVEATILADGAPLQNPDHHHLRGADLEFLWASGAFEKQARIVIGQAEEVAIRAGGWQRWRVEQQFEDWFGRMPAFLITLAADYCAQCTDAEFCSLVEHELYHVAQALDAFGAPKFTRQGMPVLRIRGHDVEEFVGVVRRYGKGRENSAVSQLVAAAQRRPEVHTADIAHACGTCMSAAA